MLLFSHICLLKEGNILIYLGASNKNLNYFKLKFGVFNAFAYICKTILFDSFQTDIYLSNLITAKKFEPAKLKIQLSNIYTVHS